MEFYALYQVRQEMMGLHGQMEDYPNLPSVLVRSVEVDITLEAINSLFCT